MTVVFTDLKGSTALGERLDAESLHAVKKRYFAAMAAEIRRHGGKVEKYIGDAIMAVFGLPRAHEDDALRAVRAADAMRSALAQVNAALQRSHGVELRNRTGVNTGEVVANIDPTAHEELATGDAVNVAARLEQAAPDNGVLIGELTFRLVCDAVIAEPVTPIEAKGKSAPVPAWRLVGLRAAEGSLRRIDTPVVGRDAELASLDEAVREVTLQRCARMVTVIGDAGAGKSRLVIELIRRLDARVQVVRGRCLPYGDGITFWPLTTMLREAAQIHDGDNPEAARTKLLALVGEHDVAERLASATGSSASTFPLAELVWAARKFLEGLAARGPLVAVVDDIHWAEAAFLELMEHVLDASAGVPMLLLATARPELLDARPPWGERPGSARLMLGPLAPEASAQIVRHLTGTAGLGDDVVARIVAAADGNPLYVEQLLAWLIDRGTLTPNDGRWHRGDLQAPVPVPPTIQALLQARLDALSRDERATAEPASVIGLEFESRGIASLVHVEDPAVVDARLASLASKRLIDPWARAGADPVYRFHHHLLRETVYHSMLKRTRADLHIAFVRWADALDPDGDRAFEHQEVLGFHLEQASRFLRELGPLDEAGHAVAADAARRLGDAGRRAYLRGDMHAATNLFQRAGNLVPPLDAGRLARLPLLAECLVDSGDFDAASAVLDEAVAGGEQLGDAVLVTWARLNGMFVRLYRGEQADWSAEALRMAEAAVPMLEAAGAVDVLARAWRLMALAHGVSGRYRLAGEATVHYAAAARAAGNERLMARSALGLSMNAQYGPMPAAEAIAVCEDALARNIGDRVSENLVCCVIAQMKAMCGDFAAARALLHDARARLRELGQGVFLASTAIDVARVELLAGDLAGAERAVRADHDFLAGKGESYYLPTVAALLACLVREQGRDEEALALLDAAERIASADDHEAQALCRLVRAPIVARAGDLPQGEALARAAIELAARTEGPILQAEACWALGQVLALAGRQDEALASAAQARALYAAKGDVVSTARLDAFVSSAAGWS
ncbi:AAA family ATPase [Aquabacterium humicola]|uniref:AAA family ATPase n=1 Tax=Aquabacterium humicola TaxID=3237377 RepID=UPI0025436490|nr:AAA family ATPase [Rubrivivax pictus]